MNITQILLIGSGILGFLMLVVLGVLFFVSRKSQHVMESLLQIMLRPERARVQDATRVLNTILAEEMEKISTNFQTIRDTLNTQIISAKELKDALGNQNEKLVTLADDATKKLAVMSQRLDNTVSGLNEIVTSDTWNFVESSTEKFNNTVNELLAKIDTTSQETTDRILQIREQIDGWVYSAQNLSGELKNNAQSNTEQNQQLSAATEDLKTKLTELAQATATGFDNIKASAADYESTLKQNNKMLDEYLDKMDSFGKSSKKQLTNQMNTITNTANVVGGQVRLAETSIEKQVRKLTDAVDTLMSSAESTETSVRNISNELATLTNRFNNEIKEFATGVVSEIKTVSGVANETLENTKTAAGAFSESVRTMATGVRETLIEMNTAHTQLSGQSESLIKMSAETTAQLQPLSELIEKYFATLPDVSRGSVEASENLNNIVTQLNEKINIMQTTVVESTNTITESATKLQNLASDSRQQMIDLMADYAKAVTTMQTLNKQMMVARATAPMEAIKVAPAETFGHISSADFLKQCEHTFEKMHELSVDLTRATGAEIPDIVWKKYHAGDKTIFSKWLAKVLKAANKKHIREMLKSDNVFKSQALQIVRGFDNMLATAKKADNSDKLSATLIKTDLGQIYIALKDNI